MAQINIQKAGSIFEVTCEDLAQDYQSLTLIDVRPEDEYWGELSHIPGSIRKTLGDELFEFLDQYPNKDQKVVFICRRGARSEMAALQAADKGFTCPINLLGGMIEWNSNSFPTEQK